MAYSSNNNNNSNNMSKYHEDSDADDEFERTAWQQRDQIPVEYESSPTSSGPLSTEHTPTTFTPAVAGSSFATVYGYDQGRLTASANFFDQGWVAPAALTSPLVVGQGYTVNLPATELVDFVGTLNTGTINLPLLRGTPSEAGWHLLGNPYPAPLDWSTVTAGQRPGMDAAVYIAHSTGQYAVTYSTYANGIGGGSPIIEPGAGYFVRVTTPGRVPP